MNKQEVIMKLEEKDNNAYEKQQAYLTGSTLFQRYEAQRIAYRTAINYVEQLDEPQKVKVPAFMAPFIEKLKITNRRYGVELEKAYNNGEDEELVNWLWFNENVLTLFRALENGYEVEEEPKWVVKVGNLYFCGWEDTTAQFVMNTVLGEDESIIKYKNEGTASSVAKNLGGTVEKV